MEACIVDFISETAALGPFHDRSNDAMALFAAAAADFTVQRRPLLQLLPETAVVNLMQQLEACCDVLLQRSNSYTGLAREALVASTKHRYKKKRRGQLSIACAVTNADEVVKAADTVDSAVKQVVDARAAAHAKEAAQQLQQLSVSCASKVQQIKLNCSTVCLKAENNTALGQLLTRRKRPGRKAKLAPKVTITGSKAAAKKPFSDNHKPLLQQLVETIRCVLRSRLFQSLKPQQLQQTYSHPLVIHHYLHTQQPLYDYTPVAVATACEVPALNSCPVVRCSQCMDCVSSSSHIIVHSCDHRKFTKQLQWEELQSLAGCAGVSISTSSSKTLNGYCHCFLCGFALPFGQAHDCNSLLWGLMVVDQNELPHANPGKSLRVLAQSALARIRREGHLIVHTIFRCPPFYLPKQLKADEKKLEMLLTGSWPLLRFPMIIGPSSIVPGQQGVFALLPLDYAYEEDVQLLMLQQHEQRSSSGSSNSDNANASSNDGSSSSSTAGRGGSNSSSHSSRSIGKAGNHVQAIAATVTCRLAGCYIGVPRSTELQLAEDHQLAVCKVGYIYLNPTLVGSMHVLFNLAHESAVVLQVRNIRYPNLAAAAAAGATRDAGEGSCSQRGTEKDAAPAAALEDGNRSSSLSDTAAGSSSADTGSGSSSSSGMRLMLGPSQKLLELVPYGSNDDETVPATAQVELTWDYDATTTDPDDALLKVACLCSYCAKLEASGKPRRNVLTLRAAKRR